MKKVLFVFLLGLLLSKPFLVQASTGGASDIATDEYNTISAAHHYYVITCGLGCKQCGIEPRIKYICPYPHAYASGYIEAHGGGGVSEYEEWHYIDDNGVEQIQIRQGSSDYGSAPGPGCFWVLGDTSWLVVNGTPGSYTSNWGYGDSTLKSKYGEYEKWEKGTHAWPGYESAVINVVHGVDVGDIGDATYSNLCNMSTFIWGGNACKEVGESAFRDCHSLTSFTWDNNIKWIHNKAMTLCPNLKSTSLPSNLVALDKGVFQRDPLTSITFPQGLTSIGQYCFGGCSKMTWVDWGAKKCSVGKYAFNNCYGLGQCVKYLPNWVSPIDKTSFRNCYGYTK